MGVGLHYQIPIWVDISRLLASHNYNIPTHQQPVGVGLHYQQPIWVDASCLLAPSPTHKVQSYSRQTDTRMAVASGPVGPAMAGPIIEPVIFFRKFNFFPAGPIIETVILIFAILFNPDSP